MAKASKGSDFEREQAKFLSKWVSAGESSDLFWRTGMSGGRSTIGAVQGVGYGDLGVLKPTDDAKNFLRCFCVELKNYASTCLFKAFFNPKDDLRKWWIKNTGEARKNGVRSLLIVKSNRKPPIMYFDEATYESLSRNPKVQQLDCLGLFVADCQFIGVEQSAFTEAVSWSEVYHLLKPKRKG